MIRPYHKRLALTLAYLTVFTFVAWFGYQSHARLYAKMRTAACTRS